MVRLRAGKQTDSQLCSFCENFTKISYDFCLIGELIFCGKYDIIYIERKLRRDFMSIINRSYCVVKIERDTQKFLSVEEICPTFEEAMEAANNLNYAKGEDSVIWCVNAE
jgi:hypothetical protein